MKRKAAMLPRGCLLAAEEVHFDVDHRLRVARADVRVRHSSRADVWLVSRYPDEGRVGYPGYTYSSTAGECPDGPDLEEMLYWVRHQSWAQARG